MADNEEGKTPPEDKGEEKPAKKVEAAPKDDKEHDDTIRWRSKYKVAKEELETNKAKTESEKSELATKIEQTTKEKTVFEQKYIQAEVKAQAVAAGIKDMDFVKLIDTSTIKIDEKGEAQGVDKAIADLKSRKPDWFGSEKKVSTSKNPAFPDGGTKTTVDARTMSKEDWRKNKSNYMAGNLPK